MNFFISNAIAAPVGSQPGLEGMLFPLGILIFFYFLFLRPQSKKAKLARETQEFYEKMPSYSHKNATKIMMAAAHLYQNEVSKPLQERFKHPYKAKNPEYGLNIQKIKDESDKAIKKNNIKNILVFINCIVAVTLFLAEVNLILNIIFPLAISTVIEFAFLLSSKKCARNILNIDEDIVIDDTDKHNIIISGRYSPFIGSGIDLSGWSFTINLNKKEDKNKELLELDIDEIYAESVENMKVFCLNDVQDKLFVNGIEVKSTQILLPHGIINRPITEMENTYIVSLIGKKDYNIRHYKSLQIHLWDSQVILTLFFRFVKVNGALLVETKMFILPPLNEKFLKIQSLKPQKTEYFILFTLSVYKALFSWLTSFFSVLNLFGSDFKQQLLYKKEIEHDVNYNYGWTESLREKWSDGRKYESYFQGVDTDFYKKLLNESLLDSLLKSLEKRNISLEKFNEASTKIFNEGIIISGGNVKADSLAVGKEASISNNAKGN